MDLFLTRRYSPTETLGELIIDSHRFSTIEPPWIEDARAGSKPMESCVPEGVYDLVPHSSRKFGETWALVNPHLQVWHQASHIKGAGRYAILLHVGNWVTDVVGCVAVGMNELATTNPPGVGSSRVAMGQLRELLGVGTAGHHIVITSDSKAGRL